MKKFFILLLICLFFTCFILPAKADFPTLLLSCEKTSYKVGDFFTVDINIKSNGNELQIVRAEISYPADLLEAQNFTLGGLFPQKSPGESIGDGRIYVGGYRLDNGTSQDGLLGTIKFKAIRAGLATINLNSGSKMITPEPKNIYSSGNSLNITLTNKDSILPPSQNTSVSQNTGQIVISTPKISLDSLESDSWTNNNSITFNWTKPDNVLGYNIYLGQDKLENIKNGISTTKNSYTYNDLNDGTWIFNLQAKYETGNSSLAYYIIKIDTVAPIFSETEIENLSKDNGENVYQIIFSATDDLSGIDNYQIKFDDSEFKPAISPYTLNNEEKNVQTITIKAEDKAGNANSTVLNLQDYIAQTKQDQEDKQALFDIQSQSLKRSWLEFYLTLSIIILVVLVSIVRIIIKRPKV